MGKRNRTEIVKLDPTVDPLTELDLRRLIHRGMPRDAVRANGTLDPDVLELHGWGVRNGFIFGPIEWLDGTPG